MNIIVESNQEEFEIRKKFFAWLDNNKTRSVWAWIIENFEPKQVKVEPEVMQKIAKGILDDLINEFTPTECVAAHVFYDRLQISVSGIIDEELGKLKAIEFTNKQTFDSLVNFAEQLKKRF